MFKHELLELCIIPVVFFALTCLSATDIMVNEKNGIDMLSCLAGKFPCATLDFVFSNLPDCNGHPLNVTIHDGNFKFTLNSIVTNSLFRNCPSVGIIGSGAEKTTVICTDDTGFSFHGLQSVKIANIKFIDCGSIQESKMINVASYVGQYGEPLFRITLYFDNCKDVTLQDVQLVNNKHTALVVNNIYGSFLIEKLAIFDQSTPSPIHVDVVCCDHGRIDENCIKQRKFSWTNKNGSPFLNMSSYYSVGKSGRVLLSSNEYISKDIIGANNCRFDDNVL